MKKLSLTLMVITLSIPVGVYAQSLNNSASPSGDYNSATPGSNTGFPNPIKATSITELFTTLLEILLIFAIPIVVFFIIYAGFLYVMAQGNTEKVGRAHRALLYAVIGGVIILGGSVLIEVVQGTVDSVRG